MDILTLILNLIPVVVWPVTLFVVLLILTHDSRKQRRQLRKGNAQARAFLLQVTSRG